MTTLFVGGHMDGREMSWREDPPERYGVPFRKRCDWNEYIAWYWRSHDQEGALLIGNAPDPSMGADFYVLRDGRYELERTV